MIIYNIDNCDIASYADSNTPYTTDFILEKIMLELIKVSNVKLVKLELITNNLFQWFNTDKCNLLVTRDTDVTGKIVELDVKSSMEEKLFGVKADAELSFENYVSSLCRKESQNLNARVVNFMNLAKRKSLKKAFITSQLNYCPLTWMFHSRQSNNRINKVHERALRLVSKDNKLTFNDLLKLDNSVTIHQQNLQILAKKYGT